MFFYLHARLVGQPLEDFIHLFRLQVLRRRQILLFFLAQCADIVLHARAQRSAWFFLLLLLLVLLPISMREG